MSQSFAAVVFLSSLSISVWALPQQGYDVCAKMDDEHDRLKCLEIVREATRPYPKPIIEMADKLVDASFRNRLLVAARDRAFPAKALSVCQPLAKDESIRTLITCIEKAGKYSPKLAKAATEPTEAYAYNFDAYEKSIQATHNQAVSGCKGWPYYEFKDPSWKRNQCWSTTHNQSYNDWTITYRREVTARGTAYDAPVPVAVSRVRTYSLYHCRADFICYRWDKDFTEVEEP